MMAGYLGRPDMTREVVRDGWFDTGDLGFLFDGELYLTGRAKDVIILRGRNHSPVEVEAAMDGVPGVRTGCAVAASWLPDGAEGEQLLVLVEAGREVAPQAYPAVAEACGAAVRAATGLAPDIVEVLTPGSLPRTSSGKLRRQESLRRYLEDELTPPEPVTALRMIGAVARSGIELARTRWGNSD
jgi:acyl-CoA synthetase (AMP-forming)/AMP-acid ligase II